MADTTYRAGDKMAGASVPSGTSTAIIPKVMLSDGNGVATSVSANDPATSYAAVTKSDSTVLTGVRSLYIGTAGDVVVQAPGGSTSVTFKNMPNASYLIGQVGKVMAATTAADIVALY